MADDAGKWSIYSGSGPKPIQVFIEDANGNFVEIGPLKTPDQSRETIERWSLAEPIPGRYGVSYVADWHGLTHYG